METTRSPDPPAGLPCTPEQAARLGEAIRFRTVTLTSDRPEAEPGYAPFAGFLDFLRQSFPRAAARLRWEQIGPLALLITWEPGPARGHVPAFLFYAHFDVVPPGDEAAWSHGAFSGEAASGYIWGRGALDDKSCLMGIMEAVESLLAGGAEPDAAFYIAFGGDEETTGHLGARVIAETLRSRGVRLACVFDEGSVIMDGILGFVKQPIAMVGIAEKGFCNVEVIVRGTAGHSSMPGRGTAAGALGAIVAGIEARPFTPRLTEVTAGFFRSIAPFVPGMWGLGLRAVRVLWPFFRRRLTANPSVDALLRTTQAVTIMRAGFKENVIPDEARAVVNMRLLPGDTPGSARDRIEAVARSIVPDRFTLEVRLLPGATASDPVPVMQPGPGLWALIRSLVRSAEPRAIVAPFLGVVYTDSRKFAAISDCIVRLHPVVLTTGELGRVHSLDERISFENYGRMIGFYRGLLRGAGTAAGDAAGV